MGVPDLRGDQGGGGGVAMKTNAEHLAGLIADPDDRRHGTRRGASLMCPCRREAREGPRQAGRAGREAQAGGPQAPKAVE